MDIFSFLLIAALRCGLASGAEKVHAYDLVSRTFLLRDTSGNERVDLAAYTAAVTVLIHCSAKQPIHNGQHFVSDQTVIDWTSPGPGTPQ